MLYWISMLFIDTLPRVENEKQNLKLSEIFLLILHHYPYWVRKKKKTEAIRKIKQSWNVFISILNTCTQDRQ